MGEKKGIILTPLFLISTFEFCADGDSKEGGWDRKFSIRSVVDRKGGRRRRKVKWSGTTSETRRDALQLTPDWEITWKPGPASQDSFKLVMRLLLVPSAESNRLLSFHQVRVFYQNHNRRGVKALRNCRCRSKGLRCKPIKHLACLWRRIAT